MNWHAYLLALAAMLSLGSAAWIYSVLRRDVSIVDSLWSLFFLLAALVFAGITPAPGARGMLVLVLVAIWSVRLSAYITLAQSRRARGLSVSDHPCQQRAEFLAQELVHRFRPAGGTGVDHLYAVAARDYGVVATRLARRHRVAAVSHRLHV